MDLHVGSRELRLRDGAAEFPALVMYPTSAPAAPVEVPPYLLDLAEDAPIEPGRYPLIIISHGSGGSHTAYWTIAMFLAQHGFIVAMPEHPGNNRFNDELTDSIDNLTGRPRHISLTIDAVAAHPAFAEHVRAEDVGIIGHSLGAYTALAVAGGRPQTQQRAEVAVTPDSRVKALALLAPATYWYLGENSLVDVHTPVLILSAEHDHITPIDNAEIVLKRLPATTPVSARTVENAGHLSFLSPFPDFLRQIPDFFPAQDPPGFDREQFHTQLPAELRDFFSTVLNNV